jgi:tetratricopeptide (TPR) repeat protein
VCDDGALQDFAQIWEDKHAEGRAGDPVDLELRAGAGIELGHYSQASEIFAGLLDSGSGEPFGVRMGLCYSSLGLGQADQADRFFNEALVHLRRPQNAQGALDDLDSLESGLGASEHRGTREAIARYREVLKARAQTLQSIDEPGAPEQELRHLLGVDRPEPGSPSWLGVHAGLARLDAEAGRLEQAAVRYQAILESDTRRTPPCFPEARVALLRLASAEAQVGFAASERADLPRTLGHFRRSLVLRTLPGDMSTPLDLLDSVAGLIYSVEQRETLEAALQDLADGAASRRDT